ncbi:MAG: TetR/AcrR family transcriptional regulator [Prolixibacteraceae bacterium]|nr:TetR/AcrR family transcriptional regulator [Prolixibacteraceae bacterium]
MNTNSQKYSDILSTAKELFWKHGIRRVSIEEVCREANVSKMTFYRFFSNKAELGREVIDKIIDESIEKYREIMSRDISFEEKMKEQLLLKFEGTREISAEFINDIFSNEKLGLKEHWLKRADEFSHEVRQDLSVAQKQGIIRKDLKLDFVFYLNNKAAEIFSDPKLLEIYTSMQELIMEYANLVFYGIFPRNSNETK